MLVYYPQVFIISWLFILLVAINSYRKSRKEEYYPGYWLDSPLPKMIALLIAGIPFGFATIHCL